MSPFLTQYIIESSICLLLFYALYHFLLGRETFFQLNRAYLLAAPLLSFLLPAIHIGLPRQQAENLSGNNAPALDLIYPAVTEMQALEEVFWEPVYRPAVAGWSLTLGEVLLIVYLLGVTLMAFRQIRLFWRMHRWISRQQNRRLLGDATLVEVPDDFPAASFLNFIFINRSRAGADEPLMLQHELVHVRQRHSLDLLAVELLIVFFWFHPLIYLFRHSLREVHEFIADRAVTQHHGPLEYARTLLAHHGMALSPRLANTFNSIIQKRLKMLARTPSPNRNYWKYLLVLPTLAGLTLLFSFDLAEKLPEPLTQPVDRLETLLETSADKALISISGETDTYRLEWGDRSCACFPDQVTNYFHCENLSFRRGELKQLARKNQSFRIYRNDEPVFIKNVEVMSRKAVPMNGFQSQFEEQGAFDPQSPFWKKVKPGNVLKVTFQAGEKTWFKFHLTVNDRRESLDYAYTIRIGDTRMAIDQMTKEGIRYLTEEEFKLLSEQPLQVWRNNSELLGLASIYTAVDGIEQELELRGKTTMSLSRLTPLQQLTSGGATLRIQTTSGEQLKMVLRLKGKQDPLTLTRTDPPKMEVRWGDHRARKLMVNLGFELPAGEIRQLANEPLQLIIDGEPHPFENAGALIDSREMMAYARQEKEIQYLEGASWERHWEETLSNIQAGAQYYLRGLQTSSGLKVNLVISAAIEFDPKILTKNGTDPFRRIELGYETSTPSEVDLDQLSRLQFRPGRQPLLAIDGQEAFRANPLELSRTEIIRRLGTAGIKSLRIYPPSLEMVKEKHFSGLLNLNTGLIEVETASPEKTRQLLSEETPPQAPLTITADTIKIIDEENELTGSRGSITISQRAKDSLPLFDLDGELFFQGKDDAILKGLNPKDIESITVLKDKKALEQYGEQGRFGVIIIRTKGYAKKKRKEKKRKKGQPSAAEGTQKVAPLIQSGSEIEVPKKDSLTLLVYPNAAANEARVRFNLAEKTQLSLQVFSRWGGLITTLHEGKLGPGIHTFTIDRQKLNLPAGTYLVVLEANGKQVTERLIFAE